MKEENPEITSMREKILEIIDKNILLTYGNVNHKSASENATEQVLTLVGNKMKGVLSLVEKMIEYIEIEGMLNEEQSKIKIKGIKHLERIIQSLCK